MKVTVQKIIIDRDMVLKPPKRVWGWEVPVLQEKYGDGKVRLLEEVEKEVRELPDAGAEFARLVNAHGTDSGDQGTNVSYAEMAYGRGKVGITALQKEIDGCIVKAKPKSKPKPKPKAKPAKKKATAKKPTPVFAGEGDGDPLADI